MRFLSAYGERQSGRELPAFDASGAVEQGLRPFLWGMYVGGHVDAQYL